MANDMHTQTRLPNPPASARPARSKPRIGGVVFQFISTMLMINGYKGLGHIDIPDYLVPKGIGFDRFLTNWGLVMAIITTSLGVLSDVLPGVTAIRSVKRAFLLIAFPLAITISSIYWPLVLIAPFLILPQKSSIGSSSSDIVGEPSSSPDTPEMFRLPLWIDLSLHALPTAVLFIEFFVRERKYRAPVSTIGAVVFTALFSLSYTSWIEYRGLDGKFPYPFLPADSMPIRLAIYVGGTIFAYASFKVLNSLHK